MAFYKKKSRIHNAGEGLFTDTPIRLGADLFVSFRKEPLNSGLFDTDYTQSQQNSKVNHGSNPNTKTYLNKKKDIVRFAIRDIKPGEEITSDYRQTMKLIADHRLGLSENFLAFQKKSAANKMI